MLKKAVYLTCLVFILAACTGPAKNGSSDTASPTPTSNGKTFTKEEVAKNNSKDSCWMIIHDRVYDVTKFIDQHPGGRVMTIGCGKDATTLFEMRPNGTPHSENAKAILEQYYVGDLQK